MYATAPPRNSLRNHCLEDCLLHRQTRDAVSVELIPRRDVELEVDGVERALFLCVVDVPQGFPLPQRVARQRRLPHHSPAPARLPFSQFWPSCWSLKPWTHCGQCALAWMQAVILPDYLPIPRARHQLDAHSIWSRKSEEGKYQFTMQENVPWPDDSRNLTSWRDTAVE